MRISLATVFLRRSIMQATVAMTPLAGGFGFGGDMIDLRHSLSTRGEYEHRAVEDVTSIVVHHTATSGQGWGPIADFHTRVKGWKGIGYHLGASWDGRTFWLNDLDRVTFHCGGCNSHTIGIAMLGNYEKGHPSEELLDAMERTILFVMEVYPNVNTIYYHGEVGTTRTACPGKYGRAWVKAFRARVYAQKATDAEYLLRTFETYQ